MQNTKTTYRTREGKQSEYTKTIGIKPKNLAWIKENKGKKSAAGFLDIIINDYKKDLKT